MAYLSDNNYKWIYTYDYAPASVWDEWRTADDDFSWIETEADAVSERVRANGNLPAFILMTDSHFVYNGTWDDTVKCLKALSDRLDLQGIIHLGDMSDGLLPYEKTVEIEERCIRDMEKAVGRLFLVPGNHDYNYFRKNPDVKYPEKPQYYTDLSEQKIRMIFIDSFDPREAVRYGFTDYCVHFLEAALRTMPADFKTIIFSHVTPLVILQAWTSDIRNRNKLVEVMNEYANRILAFINGHNHCDHLFNDLHNGQFPIISINCAKCEYFVEHKPEGAVVPERKLGDRTEQSFDVMQIDRESSRIYFTRFGAGYDRVVEDHKAHWR